MIKYLAKKLLRAFGFQVIRIPKQKLTSHQPSQNTSLQLTNKSDYLDAFLKAPLDANLHLEYAVEASISGRHYLAFAELKTAEYLGANRKQIEKYFDLFRQALPEQKSMDHNSFFRFTSLASEIIERGGGEISILDVGGGEGRLASFIPEAFYCLAEPTINGISGMSLPFPAHSFDYVVSCHVLEHIPMNERGAFLDQLRSKAKRGIILLNPFYVENTHVNERLELIVDITGADWAEEHLECTLPKLQDIQDYAADNELQLCVKPNGTLTTSLACVFIDYFAAGVSRLDDWKKLNTFFNEKYIDILNSSEYPNAYLIYLGWTEAREDTD